MRLCTSHCKLIGSDLDLYLRLMPRKFVSRLGYLLLTGFSTRWSVGSVLFLVSWAVLMGPWTYARHLISGTRLPFTAAYFGSIALTLYFAIGVSKIDFLFLSLSFPVLDSVFGLYASSRCTPTIPPPHDTPLYISLFVAHSFPSLIPESVWSHCTTGKRGILHPSHPSRSTT